MGRGDMFGGDLGQQIRAQVSGSMHSSNIARDVFGSREGGGGRGGNSGGNSDGNWGGNRDGNRAGNRAGDWGGAAATMSSNNLPSLEVFSRGGDDKNSRNNSPFVNADGKNAAENADDRIRKTRIDERERKESGDRTNPFGEKNGLSKLQRLRESIERKVWHQLAKNFYERQMDFPDFTNPYEANIAATSMNHGLKPPAVRRHATRNEAARGNPGGYPQGTDGGYSSSGQSSGGYDGGYSPSGQSVGGAERTISSPASSNSVEGQDLSSPAGSDSIPLTSAENGDELHAPDFFINQSGDRAKYGALIACGPTSLLMAIADWKGFVPSEAQRVGLIQETATDRNQQFVGGPNEMGAYAARHGIESDPGQGWTELRTDLAAGKSAIVNGNWEGWQTGHFVYVAAETADGKFVVGDPALQQAEIWTQQQLQDFMGLTPGKEYRQGGWGTNYVAVWDAEAKSETKPESRSDFSSTSKSEPNSDLSIAGPPTISPQVIDEVLTENGSPMAGMGQEFFDRCVAAGIDPAIALGFFSVESTYGTAGLATQNNNFGNIRSSAGGFRSYGSWMEGLDDWLNLMNKEYLPTDGFNAQSVDEVIPIYAPAFDGNNEGEYIGAVRSRVADWRERTEESGN